MLIPRLHSFALTVERYDFDTFYWVILESFDHSDVFEPLMESVEAFATYGAALDGGLLALKRLAGNLQSGPVDPDDVVSDVEPED